MATFFYGRDEIDGSTHVYIFGRVNDHLPLLQTLDGAIAGLPLGREQDEILLKWLTPEEMNMIVTRRLTGYDFAVRPFSDGEKVCNLPFLRLEFDSDRYERKYDNMRIVPLPIKPKKKFVNPTTWKETVEIHDVREGI